MPSLPEKILYAYARHFPLRRGKMRVINSFWRYLMASNDTVRMARLKFGGFSMRCDISRLLQRQFYFFGTYFVEENILNRWSEFASNARMVFDVGANAGIFSLAALATHSDLTVHAFEPTPEIAARLREIATLNTLECLHVHEMAVSGNSGTACLNIWEGENDGMNYLTRVPRAASAVPVRTVSLDAFCVEHGIEYIDLLKLDIQGEEAEALTGAQRMLNECRIRTIFTELNWSRSEGSRSVCPATESVRLLANSGFEFSESGKTLSFRPAGEWMRTASEIVARCKD